MDPGFSITVGAYDCKNIVGCSLLRLLYACASVLSLRMIHSGHHLHNMRSEDVNKYITYSKLLLLTYLFRKGELNKLCETLKLCCAGQLHAWRWTRELSWWVKHYSYIIRVIFQRCSDSEDTAAVTCLSVLPSSYHTHTHTPLQTNKKNTCAQLPSSFAVVILTSSSL